MCEPLTVDSTCEVPDHSRLSLGWKATPRNSARVVSTTKVSSPSPCNVSVDHWCLGLVGRIGAMHVLRWPEPTLMGGLQSYHAAPPRPEYHFNQVVANPHIGLEDALQQVPLRSSEPSLPLPLP